MTVHFKSLRPPVPIVLLSAHFQRLQKDNHLKRLHRCWRRMLEMKCVGDNFKILVTVLAIMATNIHVLHHRRAPTFKRFHQHP